MKFCFQGSCINRSLAVPRVPASSFFGGSLWREGLYYPPVAVVVYRVHQILRQGQSAQKLVVQSLAHMQQMLPGLRPCPTHTYRPALGPSSCNLPTLIPFMALCVLRRGFSRRNALFSLLSFFYGSEMRREDFSS